MADFFRVSHILWSYFTKPQASDVTAKIGNVENFGHIVRGENVINTFSLKYKISTFSLAGKTSKQKKKQKNPKKHENNFVFSIKLIINELLIYK